MKLFAQAKGEAFETEVETLLKPLEARYPNRVRIEAQAEIKLSDGQAPKVDFTLDYRLASSNHQIALECQDRARFKNDILQKISMIRTHSRRNRFWFIYRRAGLLTRKASRLLDEHGVLHFSLEELREHLGALERDLIAADIVEGVTDLIALSGPRLSAEDLRTRLIQAVGDAKLEKLKSDLRLGKYEPRSDPSMTATPPPDWGCW